MVFKPVTAAPDMAATFDVVNELIWNVVRPDIWVAESVPTKVVVRPFKLLVLRALSCVAVRFFNCVEVKVDVSAVVMAFICDVIRPTTPAAERAAKLLPKNELICVVVKPPT